MDRQYRMSAASTGSYHNLNTCAWRIHCRATWRSKYRATIYSTTRSTRSWSCRRTICVDACFSRSAAKRVSTMVALRVNGSFCSRTRSSTPCTVSSNTLRRTTTASRSTRARTSTRTISLISNSWDVSSQWHSTRASISIMASRCLSTRGCLVSSSLYRIWRVSIMSFIPLYRGSSKWK